MGLLAVVEGMERDEAIRRLRWREQAPEPVVRCPKEAPLGEPCSCPAWQGEERLYGYRIRPDDGGRCTLVPTQEPA